MTGSQTDAERFAGSTGTQSRLEGSPYTTPSGQVLLLRHCRGLAEFQACVDLQKQVWGYEDSEATPRKGFVLASELGGQVIGAFDQAGAMVGFAMAMPAFEPATAAPGGRSGPTSRPGPVPEVEAGARPSLYFHSHMLAVLPAYRRSGLGTRLKLVQREDALARGIARMTWTFDPLAAKNARLNLHKLGAIARRYSPDFYGVSSSRLQGGLPSDRLHAEWWLGSDRVNARAVALLGEVSTMSPQAPQTIAERAASETIPLPGEIERWRLDDSQSHKIQMVQSANRERFLEAFARGLAAVDFTLDANGGGLFHLAPPSSIHLQTKDSL